MCCGAGLFMRMPRCRRMETQVSSSEALQPQPSAYMGTPPLPPNTLERIPEDQATHDVALSPQDLFSGEPSDPLVCCRRPVGCCAERLRHHRLRTQRKFCIHLLL